MQGHGYKTAVRDSCDLKPRLIDRWTGVSQNMIDDAPDQGRKWLHGCKKEKGHHFEHLLN